VLDSFPEARRVAFWAEFLADLPAGDRVWVAESDGAVVP
jgi:hypothetical protein